MYSVYFIYRAFLFFLFNINSKIFFLFNNITNEITCETKYLFTFCNNIRNLNLIFRINLILYEFMRA